MRFASFLLNGGEYYGRVTSSGVFAVVRDFTHRFPDLRSVLTAGKLADLAGDCVGSTCDPTHLTFLPPIPATSQILCNGLNYHKPYKVRGTACQSDNIVIFGRHDDTLVGYESKLEMPLGEAESSFDFEGEIVAVIGKTDCCVTEAKALCHVADYSGMNEESVRGWQKHSVHASKNFFAPGSWGPRLTTADEAGLVEQMALVTRVNGTVMQQATGADMIDPLPKLITHLSNITRLNPGDVIATGFPDGTGGIRTPTALLKPRDVIYFEITTIGTLRNNVAE